MEKLEQGVKKENLPADFPMPIVVEEKDSRNWVLGREARKTRISNINERNFYFDDGSFDEEWISRMWYRLKGNSWGQEKWIPEDIMINNFYNIESLNFGQIFEQSASFQDIMKRPDDDPKRIEIMKYLSDFVMRTFSSNLRSKIDKVSELREKIKKLILTNMQKDAYFMRENPKWELMADRMEGAEPEELKRFLEMRKSFEIQVKDIEKIFKENNLD